MTLPPSPFLGLNPLDMIGFFGENYPIPSVSWGSTPFKMRFCHDK